MFVDQATEVSTGNILHNYIEILLPVDMLNVLNNVRLGRISTPLTFKRNEASYMLNLLHNFHLHVDLLVKNAMLHKSSLFELFRGIWNSIILGCDLIDNSKSALTDGSNLVVLQTPFPFSHVSTKRRC